jgi:plastocyanin
VRRRYGWFTLVQVAAVIETAMLLISGVVLRDAEALALAFVVLLTLGWMLFRPGRIIPVVVRAVVFADVAFWMAPAAVTNAIDRAAPLSIIVPGIMGVTAIIGLVASLGFVLSRADQAAGRGAAIWISSAGVVAILVITAVGLVAGSGLTGVQAGDLAISATNARFSTNTLKASAGTATVDFTNNDLFWHTFTVTELGVDIRIPVKGTKRVSFTAGPGTYEFFCAIPGHKLAGMHGTLIIQ